MARLLRVEFPGAIYHVSCRMLGDRRRHLRTYPWSSYTGYADRRKAQDFVDYGPILASMGGRESGWPKRYREFVEAGLS